MNEVQQTKTPYVLSSTIFLGTAATMFFTRVGFRTHDTISNLVEEKNRWVGPKSTENGVHDVTDDNSLIHNALQTLSINAPVRSGVTKNIKSGTFALFSTCDVQDVTHNGPDRTH